MHYKSSFDDYDDDDDDDQRVIDCWWSFVTVRSVVFFSILPGSVVCAHILKVIVGNFIMNSCNIWLLYRGEIGEVTGVEYDPICIWYGMVAYGMVHVDLYSAIVANVSNALWSLVSRKQPSFQVLFELAKVNCCVRISSGKHFQTIGPCTAINARWPTVESRCRTEVSVGAGQTYPVFLLKAGYTRRCHQNQNLNEN